MSVDKGMVKYKGRLFFKHYKAPQIWDQSVDDSRFENRVRL